MNKNKDYYISRMVNSWYIMAIMMILFLMIIPIIIQFTLGNDLLFCFILTILLLIFLIPVFRFRKANKKIEIIKNDS